VTKIENVNFDKHRLDFDQHYSHLKKGDNRLRFPLVDVDKCQPGEKPLVDQYGAYMYRRFSCHILSRINITDDMDILILGCGEGSDEKNIKNLYPDCRIWSVDISVEMISRAISSHSPSQFFLAAAECLPFPSCSFDRVISREVIEHVANPALMLNEVFRVLKPDGRAVITTENEESWALENTQYSSLIEQFIKLFSKNNTQDDSSINNKKTSHYRDQAPTLKEFQVLSKQAGLQLVEHFWDGALYKTLPGFQKILGTERIVKLAHHLSSLENNRLLAYQFCDQVKYVLERPSGNFASHEIFVSIPGSDIPLKRCSGAFENPESGELYEDNNGIPNLIPKSKITEQNSENIGEIDPTTNNSGFMMKFGQKLAIRWIPIIYRCCLLILSCILAFFVPANRKKLSRIIGDTSLIQYLQNKNI